MSGLLGRLLPDEALTGGVARVLSVLPPPGAPAGPPVLLSGLHGGAAPLLLAAWWRSAPRAALLVAPTRELAQGLADDLEEWLGPEAVVYLPQQEVLAFDRQSPDPDGVGLFLDGLDRLARGPARLAVTSLYGVRQRVMPPAALAAAAIELAVGERHDRDDLCARLAARGYRSAGMVARPGDLARRGGLIDLYAPGGRPLRVEFFDDEIVSLRTFDVESQRSVDRFETVRVLPVCHLVLDDDARLSALARAEAAAAAAGLDDRERGDLEAHLEERGHGEGLEAFLPWFGPTALLTDHLPPGAPVFWLDPVSLVAQSELLDAELPRSREVRLGRDPALPGPEELVASPAALAEAGRPHVLVAGAWIAGDASGHWLGGAPVAEARFATTRPDLRGGDVRRLHAEIARREAAGERVLVLCDNAGQAERLGELLDETGGGTLASRPAVGAVSGGFLWPEAGLACYTDHEFFERYQRPARVRRQAAGVVRDARALQGGQFVVHLDYGIGVYRGLRRITADGAERECLLIEYAEGDKVYVPVDKIEQVERFTSDSEARPELSRLGSGQWTRVTKRARKAIRAMAAELIELYASRQALEGHAYPPDGPLQRALEDSFLYDETPDQLTAIDDVKRDMEAARPMDRLVCGDVGYGKTEVAMRAAFKAVMAGRQVAVLCPTTLLARQHGETFAERFRDFPVRVETLSRFRSPREAKAVAEAAREGRVDILIGTHRLLSRDVRFKDLGLLVIDEEHRFGVRHKERLKELRRLVDVMTLSATPIPRTLYLALMGARDMSVINTPPRDRLPIHTELCQFSEETLAEAILRELHRGGQVFFVHNRIETIEATAARLREVVPGVRLGIAHGQLPEERLDRVMTGFLAHEFDVLVTTAIIESGLDMPRVNTIVIDRADRLGLAQLYQLRGRVGRSSQRAYAYLMTPPGETLTPEARRRLAALEEFQALGSGYHIAMRDLEIRGAGNLLGEEQHGHMEAIGFDLYCRLLEETVLELKGGGGAAALEVKVDLRLAAYLPDDWIGDPEQKMDLYRRLARLREGRDFARLREELRDRYGPLPGEVENLLGAQRIRVLAAACGVEEVRAERNGLALFFAGGREPSPAIIRGLMGTGPKGLMFKSADQFVMKVPAAREQVLAAAHAVLDLLDRLHRAEAGAAPGGRPAGIQTVKEKR
ncbi:MAG: transcription-repair coupling factor [Candidatus Krumholzibacteriia bacterium]